jgi:hypothetical protein
MNMIEHCRKYGFVLVAVAGGPLAGVVGCGEGFGSSDCKASRTCAPSGDAGAAGEVDEAQGSGAKRSSGAGGDGSGAVRGGDATEAGGAAFGGGAHDAGSAGAGDIDEAAAGAGGAGGANLTNPPPTIASVTPSDGATAVEPNASVVIKFSEPLDPATVTAANIRLLDGTTPVSGKLVHVKGTVTFTPSAPLALLAPYTVSVTTGVTDEAGAALPSAYTSAFSIREGAWKTIDVATDKLSGLSDALPISSAGNVLVAWSGAAGAQCPVSARWFLRGAGLSTAQSFPVANQTKCAFVSAGGNADGVGAAVWVAPNVAHGVYVPQYRSDAWPGAATPISDQSNESMLPPRVVVAPSGAVTLFEHTAAGSKAWTTDVSGAWPAASDALSSYAAETATSVAFDSKGNGLAAWHAYDPARKKTSRMMVSRLTTGTGKWGTATDLPGSAAATPNASRGAPVVAFDGNGDGMALWVDAVSASTLMANRFSKSSGWTNAQAISGSLLVTLDDPPALVFDGQGFVAAFTALDAGKAYTYTARYNSVTGWEAYERRQLSAGDTSAPRMPRLVSDGRGNLMLVFAKGAGSAFTLMYQRYAAGTWGAINALPGGSITNPAFLITSALPLSMNSSGMAALAWANNDASLVISSIRLASFY